MTEGYVRPRAQWQRGHREIARETIVFRTFHVCSGFGHGRNAAMHNSSMDGVVRITLAAVPDDDTKDGVRVIDWRRMP